MVVAQLHLLHLVGPLLPTVTPAPRLAVLLAQQGLLL